MRRWMSCLPLALVLMSWTVSAQDWVPIKLGDPADRGLLAGNDLDGSPTYIIRSPFQGGMTVGKYIPSARSAYVPWGGKENRVSAKIELYVGGGVWQPMKLGDPVPANAVAGGSEANGSLLYIIRAAQDKAVVPGKYSAGTGKGYIAWGGVEIELTTWEILVRAPVAVVKIEQPPVVKVEQPPVTTVAPSGSLTEIVARHDPRLAVFPFRVDNGAGSLNGQLSARDFQWNGRAVNAFAIALNRGEAVKLTLTGEAPAGAQDFELLVVDPSGHLSGVPRTRGAASELELRAAQGGQYTVLVLQKGPGGLARYVIDVETQGATR
jgi:hypothetical protein